MASAAVVGVRVVGAVGLGLLVVAGTASLVTGFFQQSSTQTATVAGPVTALDVSSGAGDVTVEAVAAGPTTVTARRHWTFTEPDVRRTVDGGTLQLSGSCPHVAVLTRCWVDWTVTIPAGATVTVTTSTGDVTVTGTGRSVLVRTGTGDVRLDAVGPGEVRAETGTGDVHARFVAVPDGVTVSTGTGSVDLRVPADGTAYRVLGDSGTGRRDVLVPQDASSTHVVRVDTGTGDVTVVPAP